jgi:hypothetical protein
LYSDNSIPRRYHIGLALVHDLCGIFNNTNSQWRIKLSMEYWSDHGKHNCKPDIHYDLYRDRNQFNRLLNIRFHYCDSKSVAECYCYRIAIIDLCRRIINTYSEWSNILSVEHRTDDGKYFC